MKKKFIAAFIALLMFICMPLSISAHVTLPSGVQHSYLWYLLTDSYPYCCHYNNASGSGTITYTFDEGSGSSFTDLQKSTIRSALSSFAWNGNGLNISFTETSSSPMLTFRRYDFGTSDDWARYIGASNGGSGGFTPTTSGGHVITCAIAFNSKSTRFNDSNSNISKLSKILYHEFGHMFGLDDLSTPDNRIMRGSESSMTVTTPTTYEKRAAYNIVSSQNFSSHTCSSFNYISKDSSQHYKICPTCACYTIENHSYTGVQYNATYHKKLCVCGYYYLQQHYSQYGGWSYCSVCGLYGNWPGLAK